MPIYRDNLMSKYYNQNLFRFLLILPITPGSDGHSPKNIHKYSGTSTASGRDSNLNGALFNETLSLLKDKTITKPPEEKEPGNRGSRSEIIMEDDSKYSRCVDRQKHCK